MNRNRYVRELAPELLKTRARRITEHLIIGLTVIAYGAMLAAALVFWWSS